MITQSNRLLLTIPPLSLCEQCNLVKILRIWLELLVPKDPFLRIISINALGIGHSHLSNEPMEPLSHQRIFSPSDVIIQVQNQSLIFYGN